MRREGCICAIIPSLQCATRVIIVTRRRELQTPTNTGRLAAMALANSAIIERGSLQTACDFGAHLDPRYPSFLLYPAGDAILLTPKFVAQLNTPINLVVPDGNWRQTAKMCRRDADLAKLATVKLPLGPASQYQVRKETKAEGLATIEAIARAIGILEDQESQAKLEELLWAMVEQTLRSRGCLAAGSPAILSNKAL